MLAPGAPPDHAPDVDVSVGADDHRGAPCDERAYRLSLQVEAPRVVRGLEAGVEGRDQGPRQARRHLARQRSRDRSGLLEPRDQRRGGSRLIEVHRAGHDSGMCRIRSVVGGPRARPTVDGRTGGVPRTLTRQGRTPDRGRHGRRCDRSLRQRHDGRGRAARGRYRAGGHRAGGGRRVPRVPPGLEGVDGRAEPVVAQPADARDVPRSCTWRGQRGGVRRPGGDRHGHRDQPTGRQHTELAAVSRPDRAGVRSGGVRRRAVRRRETDTVTGMADTGWRGLRREGHVELLSSEPTVAAEH